MNQLEKKIKHSHQILQKAIKTYSTNLAIAWTGGKDSTVMLHMIKQIRGQIDLPVLYLDTNLDAPETYDFMKELSKKWNFTYFQVGDPEGLQKYQQAKDIKEKSLIAAQMKITSLNSALQKYHWPALAIAIRSDEHPDRAGEDEFSQRENHMRIHPVLDFTEADIWEYIRKFKVPYNILYDQGYRSLGEEELTNPTPQGSTERGGRDQSKEKVMKKLRGLGYF